MNPLVSIVIPVYNGSNYMREAIDSALAQTYSNIEIIVVNDGSNDGGKTREIALSYGDRIRYFEKENGGVSTALNLAVEKMNGRYFSWLSHDDTYLPDKIQVEIDALRSAGDMSRVVHSNCITLGMPERIQTQPNLKQFRQEFLETGAFGTMFGFISGCTLLIPKFLFDAYGGFNPEHRAVQDYEKWFEMFRGKRLIFVRKPLVFSRSHPEQTTNTYRGMYGENLWLYHWMISQIDENDIFGSGFTDMYQFYSAVFSQRAFTPYRETVLFCINKLRELPEPPDINQRIEKFSETVHQLIEAQENTYFLKSEEGVLKFMFNLRGLPFDYPEKFQAPEQLMRLSATQSMRVLRAADFLQAFFDAPVRKEIFDKLVRSN